MTGFRKALLDRDAVVLAAVAEVGVHRSTLSRWRAGKQGLGVETAQDIQRGLRARGLDVDLGFFFDRLSLSSVDGDSAGVVDVTA